MAITADISGSFLGGAANGGMDWDINYDDATRAVVASATGTGFCIVTVQITSAITRTVAFRPALSDNPQNKDLADRMNAAGVFEVVSDGSVQTLVTGVNPNQVSRIVGKSGQVVGGLPFQVEWRPV
jgi:hypothetical protein